MFDNIVRVFYDHVKNTVTNREKVCYDEVKYEMDIFDFHYDENVWFTLNVATYKIGHTSTISSGSITITVPELPSLRIMLWGQDDSTNDGGVNLCSDTDIVFFSGREIVEIDGDGSTKRINQSDYPHVKDHISMCLGTRMYDLFMFFDKLTTIDNLYIKLSSDDIHRVLKELKWI